jgi:regulator of extracellular matrix RemA (YlzA/DUF370 family)
VDKFANKIAPVVSSGNTRSLLISRIKRRYGARANAMIKNKSNANLIKILSPNTVYHKFTANRTRQALTKRISNLQTRHNLLNSEIRAMKKKIENSESLKTRIRGAISKLSNQRVKI